MVQGLGRFYRLRGPAREGAELLATALVLPPSPLRPLLLVEQALLFNIQRHHAAALRNAAALIQLGEGLSRSWLKVQGHFLRGETLQQQGSYDAARQALEEALNLFPALEPGERTAPEGIALEAHVLRGLGNIATRRGEAESAEGYYQRALSPYRALEDRRGESAVLNNLGALRYDQGNYAEAQRYCEAALTLYRALGDLHGEAKALNNLANVAADRRDYGTALRLYREALALHRITDNRRAQSTALNNLGALYWELGLYGEARTAYREALRLYRESENRQAEGETLGNLSLLELCIGDAGSALGLAREAVAVSQASDDPYSLANAYTYLGKIHVELGDFDTAEGWYRQALALRRIYPHPGRLLELRAELAHLTWRRGDPASALVEIEPVVEALGEGPALDGAEEPYQVYWVCHEILSVNGDVRAPVLLAEAQRQLCARAADIADPELRRSFLENVPAHRRLATVQSPSGGES